MVTLLNSYTNREAGIVRIISADTGCVAGGPREKCMQRQILHKRFAAHSERLRQVREWVRDSAMSCGISDERAARIVIGVNEACMNIITHAYGDQPGEIELDISEHNAQLVIQLTDFARTVDCSKIKSRDLDDIRPGGLGVHFIQEVMDEVEYRPRVQGDGNIVVMKVKTKP